MDPLTLFIMLVVGAAISGITSATTAGIQHDTAVFAKAQLEAAIDEVVGVQKDRLLHEYETMQQRVDESAAMVTGKQQALLGVAGHAGGEGTLGATMIGSTEARRAEDQSLLDEQYDDAVADLEAQANLAKTQMNAEYEMMLAGITAGFISDIGSMFGDLVGAAAGIKLPSTALSATTGSGYGLAHGSPTLLAAGDWGLTPYTYTAPTWGAGPGV